MIPSCFYYYLLSALSIISWLFMFAAGEEAVAVVEAPFSAAACLHVDSIRFPYMFLLLKNTFSIWMPSNLVTFWRTNSPLLALLGWSRSALKALPSAWYGG